MKNTTKILIVAICVVLLAALAAVAIAAEAAIPNPTLSQIYVTAGGDVKMHFAYSDFDGAKAIVAEVYPMGATEAAARYEYPVDELTGNTVTVPLSPDMMRHNVKVYGINEEGVAGQSKAYSVYQYIKTILGMSEYEDQHNAMRTLLNWGALAEMHFNKKSASQISYGYFTHGTNPAAAVTESFAEETDGVVNGETVKVAGYQLFLEQGNTFLRMYFTYQGEERLTATIQKDGEEVADSSVAIVHKDKDEANLYYVNINNVGVAVYDAEYTVTVKAGEDSASVTKTALEYLNTIAFDTKLLGFTETQKTLAKSMYQFYVHAKGKAPTECAHEFKHKSIENNKEYDVCSNCFEKFETHNVITSGKTVNNDGTTTYTYTCNCAECEGKVVYRKTLNSTVYHADVTTATATFTGDKKPALVSTAQDENGMVYTHVETGGTQTQTVITAENVPATAVIYVKYRLANGNAPTGWIHSNVKITSADGTEHLISDGKVEKEDLVKRHNGWVVARVNAKGAFEREGLVVGDNVTYTFTIVHSDDLDIAYYVSEPTYDNVNGLPFVYSMGDDYYMHCNTVLGSYIDSQWRKIEGTSGVNQNDPFTPADNTRDPLYVEEAHVVEVEHEVVFGKTVNDDGTTTYTYTCNCAECDGKLLYRKTLNSTVFHADITSITAAVTQGEGEAEVSQKITEDGMLYTHVATHGNWVTTTISADNVPAGMVMYVKYRLANGGTPAGYLASQVKVTTADSTVHLVSSGTVENPNLVTNHKGWVVSRINVKGNFTTEGLTSGAVVSNVTMTITHRDDLDIQYFIAESGEKNADGLPYVYSMGDDYYLHVSTYLGFYQANQWRKINGTSGVTQNDPFTPPAPTRTPVYIEESAGPVEHNIVFNKADNGNGTTTYTYTCSCAECQGKVLSQRTAGNEVFNLDITKYTTGELVYDEETGRVYRHFEANGQTTTTITIENVPYGITMFMKYRLNGGATPTGTLATAITYGGLEDKNATLKGLVATGTATAAQLATYHQGWVVGRINALGNIRNHGICNSQQNSIPEGTALAQSITITFVHSEDLDIEFFITDDGEDNAGAFQTLYATGDKYYLVTAGAFGTHSGTNRWRIIPATGTTTGTWSDNATYKTPYLQDAAAN